MEIEREIRKGVETGRERDWGTGHRLQYGTSDRKRARLTSIESSLTADYRENKRTTDYNLR